MSRRSILVIALVCAAGLGLAIVPWTVTTAGLNAAVTRQIRGAYGVDLTVRGRSTIAFLPVPRLKFEDVVLSVGSTQIAEAAQLRGEFRILPLFLGEVELAELGLSDARFRVEIAADGHSAWDVVTTRLRQRVEARRTSARHIRRLVLTNATVVFADGRREFMTNLDDVNLVAAWPTVDSAVDIRASARWRGEAVQFTLSDFQPVTVAAGGKDRFSIEASSSLARLALDIEADLADGPRAAGKINFATRSVRDFTHWSGLQLPFGPLLQNATLSGDFAADRNGVSCPAVQITFGADRLDGALSARIDGGRLGLTGTLAADRLNFAEPPMPFGPLLSSGGYWSFEALSVAEHTGADLDLRLSAASARVGNVRLEDVAANLLVKPGRVEVSLGRAIVNKGTIKGRIALAPGSAAHDVKLQGSFDRLDIGSFLADLGQTRWIGGTAQGQIALEGTGESPADLVHRFEGRTTVTVRQGELLGIALGDALKRMERRPLSAPLEWRGGRTSFEQAQLTLNVHSGTGEIVDGSITASAARAALQGRISIAERSLAVRAVVAAPATTGTSDGPSLTLDIYGPWHDISVVPDARILIQRSGAARQLLGASPRAE